MSVNNINEMQREGQPVQRHSTLRRVREDLYSSIRTTLSVGGSSGTDSSGSGGGPGGGPPSSLAYHLANVLPSPIGPSVARPQQIVTSGMSGGTSWVGAPAWSTTTTSSSMNESVVSFQPGGGVASSLTSPSISSPMAQNLNQAHLVMDIEMGQPQMNEGSNQVPISEQFQARETGGVAPSGAAAGGSDQEPESGWSQILNSNPELKAIVNACERYIPFCILVFIKSVFEHGLGIIVCLGLVLTFLHSNSVVKHQIGRQGRRNVGPLLAVTANLSICTVFIYYMFFDLKLSLSAFFIPPEEVCSFVDLLWIVGINDFFLKFLSVFTKIIVTLLPAKFLPYQRRGKYYLFIEVTSQLHRQLAPIQPWLMYLLHAPGEGPSSIPYKLLGVFLTAAYMVVKGKSFLKAVELWRVALHKLLQATRYGKSPTADEMKSSNGFCPICQDTYQEPTMLHCKHIFCEECVATWFDRDTTCPMCRAKVSEDPAWRDGSTSQFIQLF